MIERPSKTCPQCGRRLREGDACPCESFEVRDLLARLELAPEQSDRRQYFEEIRAMGPQALPALLAALDETLHHPWYYFRNVIAILGELGPLDPDDRDNAARRLGRYLLLGERRQLVIAAVHSIARLGGPVAQEVLTAPLHRKPERAEGARKADSECLSPLEFATKLVEGLCLVGTEGAAGEVLAIGLGKGVVLTRRGDVLRQTALEQLSKLDLEQFPALRDELRRQIETRVIAPRFSLRRMLLGRNTRLDAALAGTLRQTRGPVVNHLYQRLLAPGVPPAIRETARQILEERSTAGLAAPAAPNPTAGG